MNTTDEQRRGLYAAFKSKDTRFDGRFFVGVSSTGIYCRPVCRAKMPKYENCTFYKTAAEAEQADYRPCLICRPELAPGRSITDATTALAHRAARYIEENCGSGMDLENLAGRLGYTGRHLRRVFQTEYHVSPIGYRQTCRLLLAKNLLTDTDLPIIRVATAAGFGSLRRFNDAFKTHYRLSPSALRKQASGGSKGQDATTLTLGYHPPYRWRELCGFLAGRAIPGVEKVDADEYLRTVQHTNTKGEQIYGWVRVRQTPGKTSLQVTISSSLLSVLSQVLARVRHLFDLYSEPFTIADTLQSMNDIKPGLFVPGIRVPGCYDPFEMVVRTVLGQQITVKAATTLTGRFVQTFGLSTQQSFGGCDRVFPSPERIIEEGDLLTDRLGAIGIIASRSKAIYLLAQSFAQGSIDLSPGANPQKEIKKLMALPGIGKWSAQYIAMRSMGWPDAFLDTDYGVKKALAAFSKEDIAQLSDSWRPWRSYAVISLWNSL
ncbi:MAG: helix-turn-helix domain-containing protein [Coriobacteriales bacterium]|nr:helix-turn-helix domain-containing protein [Coriobacteriales bacterium]